MKTKKTYSVITAEPLYSGSAETIAKGLTLKKAVSTWFAAQRAYQGDPENNPSYAEIREERREEIEIADEDVVYGRELDERNIQIWEVFRDIRKATFG